MLHPQEAGRAPAPIWTSVKISPTLGLYPWTVQPLASCSSVGPVANATDVLQPIGLLYSPYPPHLFGRSHIHCQVPPRPRRRERS